MSAFNLVAEAWSYPYDNPDHHEMSDLNYKMTRGLLFLN